MADIANLQIKVDSSDVKKAAKEVEKLGVEGTKTEVQIDDLEQSTKRLNQSSKNLKTGLGGAGRGAGQAGIQVQQFVGQVQAGQDPMVAFSQQAADLGIVLGVPLLGAVLGIAGALGTVLLPSLFKAGKSLEDLNEIANELDIDLQKDFPLVFAARLEELSEHAAESKEKIADLNTEIDAENELLARTQKAFNLGRRSQESLDQATLNHSKNVKDLNTELQKQELLLQQAQSAIDKFNDSETKAQEGTRKFTEKLVEQAETFGKTQSQILEIEAAKHGLNTENSQELKILIELLKGKEAEIEARKKAAEEKKAEALALKELNKEARLEAKRRSINEAAELAEQASRRQAAADTRKRLQEKADKEERDAAQIKAINEKALEEDQANRRKEAANTRSRLQEIVNEGEKLGLLNVERTEIEVFARRLEAQKAFLTQATLNDLERAEAQRNIESQKNDFIVKNTSDALNALGQINSSAFKAAKAFNIGQAIMSTYTGAAEALKLPFPFNLAAAGAVIATGLAQVQTIRAQTFSGRALGGQVRGGESYVVGERGAEILTMGSNQSGTIIPNNRIQAPNQVTNKVANINFNISTVDARGFDSLLQSRRGQIVTIVNQAMNDRGSRGVT